MHTQRRAGGDISHKTKQSPRKITAEIAIKFSDGNLVKVITQAKNQMSNEMTKASKILKVNCLASTEKAGLQRPKTNKIHPRVPLPGPQTLTPPISLPRIKANAYNPAVSKW